MVTVTEGVEVLFIFPSTINHNQFAEVISNIRRGYGSNWKRSFAEPVSAGFTDGISCFGRSESLGIECRNIVDTQLLQGTLFQLT